MKIRDYIPTRIPLGILKDIQASLILYPPSFKYKFDNFIFIIGKVFNIPKNNKKFENMRMVPMDSRIMKSEMGSDYRKYIDWLIIHGFMVSNRKYSVSRGNRRGYCICYGYGAKYWKTKDFEFYNIKKKSLLKREVIWNSKKIKELDDDPTIKKLRDMMENIEVDRGGAVSELEKMKKTGEITQENYEIQIDRIDKLCNKDFYFKKDEYGRFHTNFTNCKRELRKYITINGQDMVGLDIKSSQPALLYAVLKNTFNELKSINAGNWYPGHNIREIFGDVRDEYTGNGNFYYGPKKWKVAIDFKIIKGSNEFENLYEEELKKYSKILEDDIYEWVNKKFIEKYDKKFNSRSQIKKNLFSYIFGIPYKNSKMGKIWREEFPVLDKIINWIKSENYRDLARILQKKESNVVINQLCTELIENKIDNFYTIHDSVHVPIEKAESTRKIFEEILEKNNIITGISYSF